MQQKMFTMQSVFVLFHFYIIFTQAYRDSIEKVYLEPDGMRDCLKEVLVTDVTETYELRVSSKDCQTCQNKTNNCGRDDHKFCYVSFQPASLFVRFVMNLCADIGDINVTKCGNSVQSWHTEQTAVCDKPSEAGKKCRKFNRDSTIRYKAYNYCAIEGPVHIFMEPAYYLLGFQCPSESITRVFSGTVISYTHSSLIGHHKKCPVYLKPPEGVHTRKVCFKILHAQFSDRSPGIEVIAMLSQRPLTKWRFDARNNASIDFPYCSTQRQASLSIELTSDWNLLPARQPEDHALQLEFEFEDDQNLNIGKDDDDDDDKDDDDYNKHGNDVESEFLKPVWIIVTIVVVLFIAVCIYHLVRCQMARRAKKRRAERMENETFDREEAANQELNRDANITVVHDVNIRMEVRHSPATPCDGSYSGSPQNSPLLPRPTPSAPPPEPSENAPPSYDTLYPDDKKI